MTSARRAGVLATLALAACLGTGARGRDLGARERWVGTWAAAPQLTEERNMPPAALDSTTLRQRVHLSIGGARARVRFSNAFGDAPLTIIAATIAPSAGGSAIAPGSVTRLTFGGRATATIPAGATLVSDPVGRAVPALDDVAVSVHFGAVPRALTGHPGSRATSWMQRGDWTTAAELPAATRVEHWYVLAGIDVVAREDARAVVVLGNSITDGRGSGTDRDNRWPDNLARRLQADPRTRLVAVLNAGIGGNCVRRCGLGPPAVERIERDVLAQAGARWLIVLEGVNDIGTAADSVASAAVVPELIAAYESIIARARAHGLRVYGATILPFGGSFYDRQDREVARQAVNRWIRTSGAYDAVIDFDAAMRDPASPSRLRADVDGGDHLHPNEEGYRQMGAMVDLMLFVR